MIDDLSETAAVCISYHVVQTKMRTRRVLVMISYFAAVSHVLSVQFGTVRMSRAAGSCCVDIFPRDPDESDRLASGTSTTNLKTVAMAVDYGHGVESVTRC